MMGKVTEFLIQDRDNNLLAVLDPQECYECVKDQTINADNTLDLSVDITHYAGQYLKKDNRIMYFDTDKNRWYEYVMSGIDQEGYKITVHAESSLYDTLSNWIEFIDITGNTVITGLQKIFTTCSPTSNWNPGTSDITGNFQMQRTRYSLKEVIFAWAAKVGGEIDERIVIYNNKPTRYVDIKKSIGSNKGKVLYDDRDLTDINIEIPVDTIYTMAYGYGKSVTPEGSEESEPITFKDIVWSKAAGNPVDKPLGQEWVALDDEYKEKYGYYDTNGVLQHRATGYKEDGVEVPSELLQRTYDFLVQNVKDQTIYKLTAADYKALGQNPIEIMIGDIIGARIAKLGDIYISSKVLRYKEDLKNPDNNDFELENNAKNISSDIINNERQIQDLKDRVDGIGDVVFTQNILDKWNQEINAESGYLLVGSPQDGIAVYNAPTITASTKAVQLKGGSVRIANTKSGGQFQWTTVMTGDGIIANAVYTGLLAGNMFDLDLDSGIVKMGKRNSSGVINDPALQLNADGSISIKITSGDLDSVIGSINTSIGGINADIGTIEGNVNQALTDIGALNTNVSNINGSITNITGDINTLDGSIQTINGEIIQINTNISNIAVGGVNLLKNSAYRKGITDVVGRGNHKTEWDTVNVYNNNNTLKITATGPGSINISSDNVYQYMWSLIMGENVLVSFYVKGSIASTGKTRLGNSSTTKNEVPFTVTTGWTLVQLDLGKVTAITSGQQPSFMLYFDKAGTYYLNSIKVEYGTKHTTWSPAPQDTSSQLTVVEQDVVLAQQSIVKLTTDMTGITGQVGDLTTTLTKLKSAGSNLLRNTALVDGINYWAFNIPTGAQIERYKMSADEFKQMGPPTGLDTIMMVMAQSIDISTTKYTFFSTTTEAQPKGKVGQEYVLSCWYFIPSNGDIDNYIYFELQHLGENNKFLKVDSYKFTDYTVNTWHYAEMKFRAVTGVVSFKPLFAVRNRQIVYFSSMYLGEGNVSTGWSPNENDINVEILTTKTNLAQLQIQSDNITQRVTKVEQQQIGVANVLKNSGAKITNGQYLLANYSWYGVKPNTTYTIVLNGSTSVSTKKIGVWFNGGSYNAGYFPVTTTDKTMVIKVTTPSSFTVQYISFYNFPDIVEGTGTINWVTMYEGDVKPPMTWTAAPQELAKVDYVEQKLTATSLTTTISSGLAQGDAMIRTAKYVMDVNGFTIFNAAFAMYDGATVNSNRILYFDSSDASFTFVGKTLQYHTNGYLGLKIFESVIEFYSKQTSGARAGQIFASYSNTGRLVIGGDVGNQIFISTQATTGSTTYNAKLGITENYTASYVPFYFSLADGHNSYMANTNGGSKIQFQDNMNFEINSSSKIFLRFNSTSNILECGRQFKFGAGFYNNQGTYSVVAVGSDNCQRVRMVTGSNNYLELNTSSGMWGVTAWSSDGRMKKNIAASTVDATELLKQIKIRQFDWKQTEVHQDIGIIAQELQEVKEDLVYSLGEGERLQIDTANVLTLLTKALQEQIIRNDKLEQNLNYLINQTGVQMPTVRKTRAIVDEFIKQYDDDIPVITPDYEDIDSEMVPSEDVIVIKES